MAVVTAGVLLLLLLVLLMTVSNHDEHVTDEQLAAENVVTILAMTRQ